LERYFKLKGPHGEHDVFVMQPLGLSLRTFAGITRTGVLPESSVAIAVQQVVAGLVYLHEAGVIHAGN
jgi:serine/threonine-protein kinase SRPK3